MTKIKLTVKQEAFCNKYIECGNAAEAYLGSYDCAKASVKTRTRKAHELLQHEGVAARIKELQVELKEDSDITKDRVLYKLSAILDAKITDYVEFDGTNIKFKDFSELSERQVLAIESIKRGRNGIELKLHGINWTTERINKMLGFDVPEKIEHSGVINANISIAPLKKGKQTFASNEDEVDK